MNTLVSYGYNEKIIIETSRDTATGQADLAKLSNRFEKQRIILGLKNRIQFIFARQKNCTVN